MNTAERSRISYIVRFAAVSAILLYTLHPAAPRQANADESGSSGAEQGNKQRQRVDPENGLICLGYNPETGKWGGTGIATMLSKSGNCPVGHALISAGGGFGPRRAGKHIPLNGTCCPVPADMLTGEHRFVLEECPQNYVATGAAQESELFKDCTMRPPSAECIEKWLSSDQLMRCTKINTERYMLGELRPLLIWGWQPHFRTLFDKKTSKSRMPVAIRYGVGRRNRMRWLREGCVAYPWGSFVVKKTSKYCSGLFSRRLLYAGAKGDPPRGEAVDYLADCRALSDPLSPDAKCLP